MSAALTESGRLRLTGELTRDSVPDAYGGISGTELAAVTEIDAGEVSAIDSAGVAFINWVLEQTDGAAFDRTNDTVERARAQFAGREEGLPEEEQEDNVFAIAGGAFLETTRQSVAYMQLAADVTHWVIPGVFGTRHQRKGSYLTQCLRIGAESTGIVFVLSLIIGVILTVQSAVQLVQFGASIFVADLLAVSVLREMGPMITAIIVAGRSGSSIASEIATMQVTDELDALEVLGINPVRYTVIPRILAAVTMVPLLTAISVTAALIGGGAVAFAYLGISPLIFFRQASEVVDGGDLFITLLKSAVFAWQIVLVAGYYGLNATGGAAGVGKVTTQAVVASIFSVIVIDVLFSLLYIV